MAAIDFDFFLNLCILPHSRLGNKLLLLAFLRNHSRLIFIHQNLSTSERHKTLVKECVLKYAKINGMKMICISQVDVSRQKHFKCLNFSIKIFALVVIYSTTRYCVRYESV